MPVLLLAWVLALSGAARADSLEDVVECSLRNLPPSAHGKVVLLAKSAAGAERRIEADYWSRQPELDARKVVIASRGSDGMPARAYLFSDGDAIGETWEWSKGDAAARRLAANGATLFDTNVSFEDFARVVRINLPGQIRLRGDAKVGDRPVYVVEYRHGDEERSEYDRIVTSLDKERCLVLRRECYQDDFEKGEKPRKLYTVELAEVHQQNGIALPKHATLQDLRDGSSTRLEVVSVELDPKLPGDFFAPESLPRAAP